ncbi:MAG: hypothetical protein GF398_05125 [Chitinivibrionales bacterium]|nr:hypothetical protein [Chitinivibrionales bacterium]
MHSKLFMCAFFCFGLMLNVAGFPFLLGCEAKLGYLFPDVSGFFENEIILKKDFDILNGLAAGAENLLTGDIGTPAKVSDEITLGVSLALLPFLSTAIAGKTFLEDEEASFGVDGLIGIELEFEESAVSISDENEFLYHINNNEFEYVNTFYCGKSFSLRKNLQWFIECEHEFIAVSSDRESCLLAGPGLSVAIFDFYVHYVLVAADAMKPAHGFEGGLVCSF